MENRKIENKKGMLKMERLGKDVLYIIYRYIHHMLMSELNIEYHQRVEGSSINEGIYFKGWRYNYRRCGQGFKTYSNHIFNKNGQVISTRLPVNYW